MSLQCPYNGLLFIPGVEFRNFGIAQLTLIPIQVIWGMALGYKLTGQFIFIISLRIFTFYTYNCPADLDFIPIYKLEVVLL